MRSLALAACIVPACASAQAGVWIGHVHCDAKILMKQSNQPEFKKLMAYTIARLEKAKLSLTLSSNGKFEWDFDDGYVADKELARGIWHAEKSTVFLDLPGRHAHTEKLLLTNGNTRFTTLLDDIPGVTCEFHKGK